MNYFLIFIMTALLHVYTASHQKQARVKVTFESASLAHHHTGQSDWRYSALVNDLSIKKGKSLEFMAKSDSAIRFNVSANESIKNVTDILDKLRDTGSIRHHKMFLSDLNLKNPSVVNTYGSNTVSIDMHELMQKKPHELNLFVTYNKKAGPTETVGKSTELVFKFNLTYE